MIFETKHITLKDGRTAILRSPERDDAPDMMNFLRDLSSETDFILRCLEECVETDEREAEILEGINNSAYSVMIACFVDGEVAGNCTLSFKNRIKVRHRASVGIGLRQKYWNLGIGTAMFSEMIEIAKAQGVMQLELDYIEGNERAKRLYEKMGFVQVAEHPDAIRLKDGTLLKEFSMIQKL